MSPSRLGASPSSLLTLAGGTQGEDAARLGADGLRLTANYHSELLAGRTAALVGAILAAVSEPLSIEPGHPQELHGMLRMGAEALRAGRLAALNEALGELAKANPDEVSPEVTAVLDADDPPEDSARDLRVEMTKLLGPLGVHPRLREVVLPRLYSALLSGDQVVRAAGIDAWRELERVPHFRAPPELEDLIPAMLSDPYVIVHRGMIRALRWEISVPERLVAQVLVLLMQFASHYADSQDQPDMLKEVLGTLWSKSSTLDDNPRLEIRRRVLLWAEKLHPIDLARLLMVGEGAEQQLPEYCDRLIDALVADESTSVGDREDELLRRLRDQPIANVQARADRILDAGTACLPRWTQQAAEYLEILEGSGCWAHAEGLVTAMDQAVPDDTAHAVQHAEVVGAKAHVALEQALGAHDWTAGRAALKEWQSASGRAEEARAQRRSPFDLLEPDDA